MIYFLTILLTVYVIYTFNFAIQFNKTNTSFNENQKLLHNFLIWIIPFFWIMILKTIIKPTSGSDKFKKNKPDAAFYESGIGIWGHGEGHDHSDGGNGDQGDD